MNSGGLKKCLEFIHVDHATTMVLEVLKIVGTNEISLFKVYPRQIIMLL